MLSGKTKATDFGKISPKINTSVVAIRAAMLATFFEEYSNVKEVIITPTRIFTTLFPIKLVTINLFFSFNISKALFAPFFFLLKRLRLKTLHAMKAVSPEEKNIENKRRKKRLKYRQSSGGG
jgi:hypothetical protein